MAVREKTMSPKAANSVDAYVAGRLRSYRKQLGFSQAEVAKELGVSFQQIQKYEAGHNRVGAGRLFQLASLYGIPIQEFFPRGVDSSEGARRTAKLGEIDTFTVSAEGWKLCDAFLHIKDAKQRKIVISLVQEMAEE
jgi:transcriptional regulator with XRE-family HTH domain